MRAVVSRVAWARVVADGELTGEIGPGLLVLVGVTHADTEADADWLAAKVAALRVFADDQGKMNRSLTETGGAALVGRVREIRTHGLNGGPTHSVAFARCAQ